VLTRAWPGGLGHISILATLPLPSELMHVTVNGDSSNRLAFSGPEQTRSIQW